MTKLQNCSPCVGICVVCRRLRFNNPLRPGHWIKRSTNEVVGHNVDGVFDFVLAGASIEAINVLTAENKQLMEEVEKLKEDSKATKLNSQGSFTTVHVPGQQPFFPSFPGYSCRSKYFLIGTTLAVM